MSTEPHFWDQFDISFWHHRPDLNADYWHDIRKHFSQTSPRNKATVLEIACGIGKACLMFPDFNYVGIDISEKAIAAAGYYFDGPRRRFACGNVLSYELPKANCILCGHFLDHVQDYRPILAEILHRAKKTAILLANPLHDEPDVIRPCKGYWNNTYNREQFLTFVKDQGHIFTTKEVQRQFDNDPTAISTMILTEK